MFYVVLILAGLIALFFGVKQYRRAKSKALPVALILLGVLLVATGSVILFLVATNQLAFPLN